jgi:hypothetical protein
MRKSLETTSGELCPSYLKPSYIRGLDLGICKRRNRTWVEVQLALTKFVCVTE